MADMLPKATVIKLTSVRLASGVVDVLYINKDGDFFQCRSLIINKLIDDNIFDVLRYVQVVDHLV